MLPLWFKLIYLGFVAVLIPVYAVEHGLPNFLWFSNVALLGGLAAAWLESRRLASMMLVAVLLLEMGWIADFLAGLLLGGVTPFGFVQYMFDPAIPALARALSLYHLALPFVLFWMAWRLKYDRAAWRAWLLPGNGIVVATFLFNPPDRNINWIRGPAGETDFFAPLPWLAVLMAGLTLIWWLTHQLNLALMRRLDRLGQVADTP
jgi:hypothetical protein